MNDDRPIAREKLFFRDSLHRASGEGDLDKVKSLIEDGADVNVRTAQGSSALFAAIFYDNLEIVKFLLEKGADINARTIWGQTPLKLAREMLHLELIKLLINKGATE